jgi:hypothetical protein
MTEIEKFFKDRRELLGSMVRSIDQGITFIPDHKYTQEEILKSCDVGEQIANVALHLWLDYQNRTVTK